MAQEIVTWCDPHLDEDERVYGTRRQIALNGQAPKVLDVCDDCEKEILGPVLTALELYGRSPKAPPGSGSKKKRKEQESSQQSRAQEGMSCPVPDCETDQVFHDRSTIRGHVRSIHDEDLPVLEARAGKTVEGLTIKFLCEEPNCEAGFATPQGRGAHMSHRHGYGRRSAA